MLIGVYAFEDLWSKGTVEYQLIDWPILELVVKLMLSTLATRQRTTNKSEDVIFIWHGWIQHDPEVSCLSYFLKISHTKTQSKPTFLKTYKTHKKSNLDISKTTAATTTLLPPEPKGCCSLYMIRIRSSSTTKLLGWNLLALFFNRDNGISKSHQSQQENSNLRFAMLQLQNLSNVWRRNAFKTVMQGFEMVTSEGGVSPTS